MGKQIVNDELWGRIKAIDLTYPLRAAVVKEGFTIERAILAVESYRQYLYSTQLMPGLSPTKDVDIVWHRHCLDMKKYEEDCLSVFGRMIYHEPKPIDDKSFDEAVKKNALESSSINSGEAKLFHKVEHKKENQESVLTPDCGCNGKTETPLTLQNKSISTPDCACNDGKTETTLVPQNTGVSTPDCACNDGKTETRLAPQNTSLSTPDCICGSDESMNKDSRLQKFNLGLNSAIIDFVKSEKLETFSIIKEKLEFS